jgi:hypothetical protein
LSSWYKFVMNKARGDEFANFIVSIRTREEPSFNKLGTTALS